MKYLLKSKRFSCWMVPTFIWFILCKFKQASAICIKCSEFYRLKLIAMLWVWSFKMNDIAELMDKNKCLIIWSLQKVKEALKIALLISKYHWTDLGQLWCRSDKSRFRTLSYWSVFPIMRKVIKKSQSLSSYEFFKHCYSDEVSKSTKYPVQNQLTKHVQLITRLPLKDIH